MRDLIVIAHNIRSTHNVGSLLRTAEFLGVKKIYLTGYTPYPKIDNDPRLPHLASKIHSQISKTSLGAESTLEINASSDIFVCVEDLKSDGYKIIALEQTNHSTDLAKFKSPKKIALIIGNERYGVEKEILDICDDYVEIPKKGKKESLNVVQAVSIAIYKINYL